jgi:alpha-ketoglutarate-dependent taurine dioxygenase
LKIAIPHFESPGVPKLGSSGFFYFLRSPKRLGGLAGTAVSKKPKRKRRNNLAPRSKPRAGGGKNGRGGSSNKGVDALQLLRLSSLKVVHDYVARFDSFARTCDDEGELRKVFSVYRRKITTVMRLRIEDDKERLHVDIHDLDDGGRLELTCWTEPTHQDIVPTMGVLFDQDGKVKPVGAGEGVAPYCLWRTSLEEEGVAIAKNVHRSKDIYFFRPDLSVDPLEGTFGWYTSGKKITDIYKPVLTKAPSPYKSLMSTTILMPLSGHARPTDVPKYKGIGVLNVTHTAEDAFSTYDYGWCQACAGVIGHLYRTFLSRRSDLLARTPTKDAPASAIVRDERTDVCVATDKSPVVIGPPTPGRTPVAPARPLTASPEALSHARIEPWPSIDESEYMRKVTIFGPGEQIWVLERLQQWGFCLVRTQGADPSTPRLEHMEDWLGKFRSKQNDYEGKIKEITPDQAKKANTGDSALELTPHVDGTQDPTTPAILVFEYVSSPSFGGSSSFLDMAMLLNQLTPEEQLDILVPLADPHAGVCSKKGLTFKGPLITTINDHKAVCCRLRFDDEGVLTLSAAAKPAFEKLREMVLARKSDFLFSPEEGDYVIFDNRRVLHGRKSLGGTRHLRLHKRVWVDELLPKHRGKYQLGVRGLSPEMLLAIKLANEGKPRKK